MLIDGEDPLYNLYEFIPIKGGDLYMGKINDRAQKYYDVDLSKYVDKPLRNKVLSICCPYIYEDYEEGDIIASWIVTTNQLLTKNEEEELVNEINGQASDGWGEGFEQQDIDNYSVSVWSSDRPDADIVYVSVTEESDDEDF